MNQIKKISFAMLCMLLMGNQTYAMEHEETEQTQTAPTRFTDSPKQWLLERMQNAHHFIVKNLAERSNSFHNSDFFKNHYVNDPKYQNYLLKNMSPHANLIEEPTDKSTKSFSSMEFQPEPKAGQLLTKDEAATQQRETEQTQQTQEEEKQASDTNNAPDIDTKAQEKAAADAKKTLEDRQELLKRIKDLQGQLDGLNKANENLYTPELEKYRKAFDIVNNPEASQHFTPEQLDKYNKQIETLKKEQSIRNKKYISNLDKIESLQIQLESLNTQKEQLLKEVGTLVSPDFKPYQTHETKDSYIKRFEDTYQNSTTEEFNELRDIQNLGLQNTGFKYDLHKTIPGNDKSAVIKRAAVIIMADSIYQGLIEDMVKHPFDYQAKFNALKPNAPYTSAERNAILAQICPAAKDLSETQTIEISRKLNNSEPLDSLYNHIKFVRAATA